MKTAVIINKEKYEGLNAEEISEVLLDWHEGLVTIANSIIELTDLANETPDFADTALSFEMIMAGDGRILDIWNYTPIYGCPYKFSDGDVQIKFTKEGAGRYFGSGREYPASRNIYVKCRNLFDDEEWYRIWTLPIEGEA